MNKLIDAFIAKFLCLHQWQTLQAYMLQNRDKSPVQSFYGRIMVLQCTKCGKIKQVKSRINKT